MPSPQIHSEVLDAERCNGCTACVRECPTEALRVKDGKATTIEERCIDCGHCIRSCPYHAKGALTDPLDGERLQEFKYTVAVPSPVLYSQFCSNIVPDTILTGLQALGFDYIFDEALGCEILALATQKYLGKAPRKKPLISSACPALVRLVQVRFPSLIDNLAPFPPPEEITAQIARKSISEKLKVDPQEIGVFSITPCTAKVSSIRKPVGLKKSHLDGAISIVHIYSKLITLIKNQNQSTDQSLFQGSVQGISWARSGGQVKSIKPHNYLVVDGLLNVINILEEIELGIFQDLDYIECSPCTCGCVGGPLAVTNPFMARIRVRELAEKLGSGSSKEKSELFDMSVKGDFLTLDESISSRQLTFLSDDIYTAIQLATVSQEIQDQLPGLNCCSCGYPSCQALADDVARKDAEITDCIFKLMEGITASAQDILALSNKANLISRHHHGKERKK